MKASRAIPMVLYSILIFGLSSVPGKSIPSQVSPYSLLFHFVLYFFYSLTLFYLFREPYYAYLFGVIYAASDEIHQYFVPGRSCDPVDFMVDSAALATGTVVVFLWNRFISSSKREHK